jgi:hypothetical protein
MLVLLVSLMRIADLVNNLKLNKIEKLMIKIPFGVYLGWITIAAIANITVFLVSIDWNGFGVPDYVWMIIILIAGVIISSIRMIKDKNLAFGLVPVWAYFGILIKHTSINGFNYMYPQVITTVICCLVVLLLINSYLIKSRNII